MDLYNRQLEFEQRQNRFNIAKYLIILVLSSLIVYAAVVTQW